MDKGIILINFKTYKRGTGSRALETAKICDKLAKELNADIRIAVQAADIRMIAKEVSIPVYAQSVDGIAPGKHSGWTLPEAVKEAGAVGTLINHSEHQISMEEIEAAIKRAKEVGLTTVVCAATTEKGVEISKFNPDFVGIEPPELIGSDVSVSTGQPELIKSSFDKIAKECNQPILVGAGVKTAEDTKIALEYGALGIILASQIMIKSDNAEQAIRDLLNF